MQKQSCGRLLRSCSKHVHTLVQPYYQANMYGYIKLQHEALRIT